MKNTSKVVKISLSLALMLFVFTMTPASSFFNILKPASAAGTLTDVVLIPKSNLVSTRSTYDIMFKTGTTGTIKTVEISFLNAGGLPGFFNLASATRLIERSGIGSGTLSVSGALLKYTVSSPVSIPAGTAIKLEIGRIVANFAGSWIATITTKDTAGGIIDGPKESFTFPIVGVGSNAIADNSITGTDVSTAFMIRKTLKDDDAGHAQGWNPIATNLFIFAISDPDITGSEDNILIDINVDTPQGLPVCSVARIDTQNHQFTIGCNVGPADNSILHYTITKLPSHVVTSSQSVSESAPSSVSESAPSSPFDSSQASQNLFPPSLP